MTHTELSDKLASDAASYITKALDGFACVPGEEFPEKVKELCCLKELLEAVAMLKKYQARYHGAEHAQKDWEKSDAILTSLRDKLKERGIEL